MLKNIDKQLEIVGDKNCVINGDGIPVLEENSFIKQCYEVYYKELIKEGLCLSYAELLSRYNKVKNI